VTLKEHLLATFDETWDHRWESFALVIKDVDQEMAQYQHPAYSSEADMEYNAKNGSLIWHIAHLAHCHLQYADVITGRPEVPTEPQFPNVDSLEAALEQITLSRAKLRSAIESVSEDQLSDKVCSGDTVAGYIQTILRHDAWHFGQMAVVKRLYRSR
jgi:uncharacterized damage-inducible protein DinB